MYMLSYPGEAKAVQRVAPGDTVFGISPYCYQYKEFTFTYNSGGPTAVVAGYWIKGATTGCQAKVIEVGTLTGGSWAGSDAAGTLRVASVHGSATSASTWFNGSENVTVLATANDLTMTSTLTPVPGDYYKKDCMAKAMLVNVMTQTLLCNWDGSTPDQNQLIGMSLAAGSSVLITDINAIKNFKFVDRVSGTTGLIELQFYF